MKEESKQRIVIVEGPDGVGKTHIARELARRLGIPYFKPRGERENWELGEDSFLNELVYGENRQIELVRQTGVSFVQDRGFPSEYVYSKVFGRPTSSAAISAADAAYAGMGATVVVCLMSDYGEARQDDLVPHERLWEIHDAYREFRKLSMCQTIVVYTDLLERDIEREMRYISRCTGWLVNGLVPVGGQ